MGRKEQSRLQLLRGQWQKMAGGATKNIVIRWFQIDHSNHKVVPSQL